MRLQNIDINPSTNLLEIDIINKKGSFAIVVSDGKARLTELPEHGETKIITHQGKVKRVDTRYQVDRINQMVRGCVNYFKVSYMKKALRKIDAHTRFRVRMCIWKK